MRVFRQTAAEACALLFIFLLTAGQAHSARLTFTRFSLDVPAGWRAFEQGNTVAVTSDDGSSSLTITIQAHEGEPLKQWAQNISRQLEGELPEWDGKSYSIPFVNANGLTGQAVVEAMQDGYYRLVVATGENPDLYDILDTVEDL